jgi:hypothetical protein
MNVSFYGLYRNEISWLVAIGTYARIANKWMVFLPYVSTYEPSNDAIVWNSIRSEATNTCAANHYYNSPKISNSKRKKSESSFDGICGNDIEEYIDTFHRIKKDIKYMLNNTISERKREFLRSYSLNFFTQIFFS